jgi:hypothetical protein
MSSPHPFSSGFGDECALCGHSKTEHAMNKATTPPDNTEQQIRDIIGDDDWKYTDQPYRIQALITAAADGARRETLNDFKEWTTIPIVARDLDQVTLAALRIAVNKSLAALDAASTKEAR